MASSKSAARGPKNVVTTKTFNSTDFHSLVLGFSEYEAQGRRLAETFGLPFRLVDIHRFPDGESKVTLPPELPRKVIFCRSLDRPNDKLVELLLAAETARELGAERLTLVSPYLCYMRQDTSFHPGEAVSQRIIGHFLARLFDEVITVDPHLHRVDRLDQAIPAQRAIALSAAPLMTEFLERRTGRPLLVGPDAESEQWVRAIAEPAGLDFAVATKERRGDRSVRVTLPERDFAGRDVVLIDDMASTGRTLIAVAERLRQAGAASIRCLVTHPLFADQVTEALGKAGIDEIWSTDSIAHPSNAIPLAEILAEALRAEAVEEAP